MKVHSISSLAVALAAATLSPGMAAQDACSEGCSSTQAASAPRDAVAVLAAPLAPAVPASLTTVDDPPRLGVAIDITDNGIRVDEVIEGSLAEAAGVQSGDLIFRLNGTSIIGPEDIATVLSEIPPGGEVNVTVIRDGEGLVGLTTNTAKPEPKLRTRGSAAPTFPDALADGFRGGFLGVTLGEGNDMGVAVVSIVPASSAWYAGLDGGDVIVAIDGESVGDPDDVVGAISSREYGTFIDIQVIRSGQTHTMRARLGQRGPTGAFGLFDGGQGMNWIQPNTNGMSFEFPENLQQFEFGDGNVFEWSDDGDGEAKFYFKGGDALDLNVDPKALIEKARKNGANVFEWKSDGGDGTGVGGGKLFRRGKNGDSAIKMLRKGGGNFEFNFDGDTKALIEKARKDGANFFEWKDEDGDGSVKFLFKGDDVFEFDDNTQALINKVRKNGVNNFTFELDSDTEELIEKARENGASVFQWNSSDPDEISSLLNERDHDVLDGKIKAMLKKGKSDGDSDWIVSFPWSELDGDNEELIKKARENGASVFQWNSSDPDEISSLLNERDHDVLDGKIKAMLKKGKSNGGSGWIIEKDGADGLKLDAIIEGAMTDGKVLKLKGGAGNGFNIDAIIDGVSGEDGKRLKLRKDRKGTIKKLRKGGSSTGGKSSQMKITINGDKVIVNRDGKIEKMTLDELGEIEGLELHMHDGSSLLEWAHKHGDDASAEVHVEVHKSHEKHDDVEHEHGDV